MLHSSATCLDSRPLFVNQSSVCWYVLSIGLSCYLFDLLLRKSRRSRCSIQLLDFRSDSNGNLIELILSSNHKRFAHWLPGQFVYLNCPQIAAYEWHPFTISSMDNRTRQFTLHIKTGGDWTRKLRNRLLLTNQNDIDRKFLQSRPKVNDQISCLWFRDSISRPIGFRDSNIFYNDNDNNNNSSGYDNDNQTWLPHLISIKLEAAFKAMFKRSKLNLFESKATSRQYQLADSFIVPNFDCYNEKTGKLDVKCTKLATIYAPSSIDSAQDLPSRPCSGYNIEENQVVDNKQLYQSNLKLDLFIDGPFHSPFERLLEQRVSVCIASGVGWTAFSSIFHSLTNNLAFTQINTNEWWIKWHRFAVGYGARKNTRTKSESTLETFERHRFNKPFRQTYPSTDGQDGNFSCARIHLLIIVPSIEQLRPFYQLTMNYYQFIQDQYSIDPCDRNNPIRDISVFLTRCRCHLT